MAKQTFTTGQVLTAAQMTSLQQTAMGGGAATAKTASYVLVAADAGTTVAMNAAGATTITVNTSLFAAGDTVYIQNLGAGVSTITAGTATVDTSATLALAQYEGGQLYFTSTSASIFVKGAGAAGGGMTLISQTVASAVSSLTFGSISGSYKQLLLIWSGIRHSATGSGFDIRLNNNSGSVYPVQLTGFLGATGTTVGDIYTSISGTAFRSFGLNANGGDLRLDVGGFLLIDNYASSTKAKSFNGAWNFFDNTSGNWRTSNSVTGIFNSTTAVTSIDIFRTAGTATFSNTGDTTIRLYGVA